MDVNVRLNSAPNYPKEDIVGTQRTKTELTNANAVTKTAGTNAYKVKQLQPDVLVLSEEAQHKAAETKAAEQIKGEDFMALGSADEPEADVNEQEKALEEAISKLSIEIMEISIELALLKTKDDEQSLKESQALENELAFKKAMLEAKVSQQLELAKSS